MITIDLSKSKNIDRDLCHMEKFILGDLSRSSYNQNRSEGMTPEKLKTIFGEDADDLELNYRQMKAGETFK